MLKNRYSYTINFIKASLLGQALHIFAVAFGFLFLQVENP